MRILGLDFGDKTIGVAVSDPSGVIAFGLETIKRDNPGEYKKSMSRISEIIDEYDIKEIVLGFPKNMDGSEGTRCEKTREFKDRLKKRFKLPVILWDERLSTIGAERVLMEADLSRAKRKAVIDKMAALYILEGYLQTKGEK